MVGRVGDRELLYRILIVSEMTGMVGRTAMSRAAIVGVSAHNNRRDEISSALLFHEGVCAQMLEGMRTDLDRLLVRLRADRRHSALSVLSDRPIVHRRVTEPIRLVSLSAQEDFAQLGSQDLLSASEALLEQLLTHGRLRDAKPDRAA